MSGSWLKIGKNQGPLKINWAKKRNRLFADPYLIWADITDFLGYVAKARSQPDFKVQVALSVKFLDAKLAAEAAATSLVILKQIGLPNPILFIPIASFIRFEGEWFFTGRFPIDEFGKLFRWLRNLQKNAKIEARLELGVPLLAPNLKQAEVLVKPKLAKLRKNVLVVIDDGCPFARVQLCRKIKGVLSSRVKYFWDQAEKDRKLPSRPPSDMGYGHELTGTDIDQVLGNQPRGEPVDEAAVYREFEYAPMQERETHGAHILDISAGNPDPLKPGAPVDEAGDADIIFVQLPREAVADTSGGAMNVFIHDAIAYALARIDNTAKVVINLSYGTHAGPHDGQSLIERFMDARLEMREDMAIALSAGNAYNAQCHASANLSCGGAPGDAVTFQWEIAPSDPTDSFMEIWCEPVKGSISSLKLEVVVTTPDGMSCLVRPDKAFVYRDDSSLEVLAAVINNSSTPNGEGPMILCAVAPTAVGTRHKARPISGIWTVKVTNKSKSLAVRIDAWMTQFLVTPGPRVNQSL
jgi:Subtilase family